MPETPVENRGSEDRVRALLTSGKMFLTLAGVETDLMFRLQFPLRSFAAFEVFADRDAHQRLIDAHLKPIAQSAREHGYGLSRTREGPSMIGERRRGRTSRSSRCCWLETSDIEATATVSARMSP
jgi:hypothetical protein